VVAATVTRKHEEIRSIVLSTRRKEEEVIT